MTLLFRLTSTLWKVGYLPADATGDWAYQCLELSSFGLAVWLYRRVKHTRRVRFGSEAEALTSHFIALTTLSRVFSLYFWYNVFEGYFYFRFYFPGGAIIGAHVLQLILACDFLFLYARSFGKRETLGTIQSQWL